MPANMFARSTANDQTSANKPGGNLLNPLKISKEMGSSVDKVMKGPIDGVDAMDKTMKRIVIKNAVNKSIGKKGAKKLPPNNKPAGKAFVNPSLAVTKNIHPAGTHMSKVGGYPNKTKGPSQ